MSPVELYLREALEVHNLLDRADVPRIANGERLSMSQRLELYMQAQAQTARLIGTLRLRR